MLQGRGVRALWGSGVLLAAVWACETARNPAGIQRDLTPPTISLTKAAPDTQDIAQGLTFSVSATDNLGLKDIRLTYTGGYIALTDTVFFSAVTASSIPVHITFPSGSGAGGRSEEHTSELQSPCNLVCRLLLEKKKRKHR